MVEVKFLPCEILPCEVVHLVTFFKNVLKQISLDHMIRLNVKYPCDHIIISISNLG